jgi:UTP--glucose-1-phosphate uridylyltransferase
LLRCPLTHVTKAVILAAGYGTRMLPATKSQPKEMLPVVDRPVIHYAVEELANSGIEQVVIVTAISKRAVEDYFDRSRDIEALLAEKGDAERLREVQAISSMVNVAYVRQAEMRGLADAVSTARHLVDDEPFVLVLPDDIMLNPHGTPPTRQLIECHERYGVSVVAVEEVPEAEVSSYGIVAGRSVDERVTKLERLVEKPRPSEAPSRLAIVGRYLLTQSVWNAIDRIQPGYGGELQITDALQIVAAEEGLYAYRFQGTRFDTGRPLSFLQASIELALRRPDVAPGLRAYLRGLNLEGES